VTGGGGGAALFFIGAELYDVKVELADDDDGGGAA
jgi:hypothetical protein